MFLQQSSIKWAPKLKDIKYYLSNTTLEHVKKGNLNPSKLIKINAFFKFNPKNENDFSNDEENLHKKAM